MDCVFDEKSHKKVQIKKVHHKNTYFQKIRRILENKYKNIVKILEVEAKVSQ